MKIISLKVTTPRTLIKATHASSLCLLNSNILECYINRSYHKHSNFNARLELVRCINHFCLNYSVNFVQVMTSQPTLLNSDDAIQCKISDVQKC